MHGRKDWQQKILLEMYGKCGAILEAKSGFLALSYQDIVSFSAYLERDQSTKVFGRCKRKE